jgi:hypothetical protein
MSFVSKTHESLAQTTLALAILMLVAAVFWIASPKDGDFAWSDAPRHAMNGIFGLDRLKERPIADPKGWAEAYYIQYPALSILFYPPLFSFVLAGFYAAFGLSHETAQAAVAVFHMALMSGMYILARRWLPWPYAIGAALALGAAPEIGLWARQVMLDIPAYALLLWSVVFLLRYLSADRLSDLFVTTALLLASLYTKQNAIFAVVPMAAVVLYAKGWSELRRLPVLATAAFFLVALLPLVFLQLEFGSVNAASVLGSERDDAARSSLNAWTFYAAQLPRQLGWPVVLLAAIYVGGATVDRSWRLPGRDAVFLVLWLVNGYLFFSFIMVREPRHDLMALWPVVAFALLGLHRLLTAAGLGGASWSQRLAPLSLGALMVGWSLLAVPVPYVQGYKTIAEYVTQHSPADSNILFNGYRDGNFVFDVRVRGREDVGILRADKLLLRLAIERQRGVDVVETSRDELLDYFRRYRIRYVVSQPDFWTDLESMELLSRTLADTNVFRMVTELDLEANYNNTDKQLRIYEYLGEIADEPEPVSLEMVGIGRTFSED